MKVCHKCKKEISIDRTVGRNDVCPFCSADLRCCLNCRHYDQRSYNQCREPQAERVLDKDRSNFCDYFNYKEVDTQDKPIEVSASARNKLNDLFKK